MSYKNLTIRYIFALSVIGLVIAGAFFLQTQKLKESENDAYIVNISGMQRMISQRMAFLAREYQINENSEERKNLLSSLAEIVARMKENHQILVEYARRLHRQTPSELTTNLQSHYFNNDGLDQHISHILGAATKLSDTDAAEGTLPESQKALIEDIVFISQNGLLEELDEAVTLFQLIAEQKIEVFRGVEKFIFMLGIYIILMEILFIFRPMIQSIAKQQNVLEERNQELLKLTYQITHDLKAPVVSSIGMVEMGRNGLKEKKPKEVEMAFGYIEETMVQLESLIKDINTILKNKSSKEERQQFSVKELLREAILKVTPIADSNGVRINLEADDALFLNTRKNLIRQALDNLVSNAVLFSDKAKKERFLNITAKEGAKNIVFEFEDNGLGVSEKYRDRLFNMFERFHPEKSNGSGLGLYIASQNIKMLGGKVSHEGTESGSRFIIEIPVAGNV